MALDKKEIIALADLAKLALEDREIELYQEQLKEVLSYVDKIKELDLAKIKESLTGVELGVQPRIDKVKASQPDIIKQASKIEDSYVATPQVFNNK